MATNGADGDAKSKRPSDSAFKQQRLPAWQPILTAGTVLPTFFVIGIAFIPIGIGLLYFSDQVSEFSYDYTDCTNSQGVRVAGIPRDVKYTQEDITCRHEFNLTKSFQGPVFMYYGLTNFYQNHRRYVKSRDDNQLRGVLGEPSTDCEPFRTVSSPTNQTPILPCGAIANSLFSDELTLWSTKDNQPVPLLRTGIAWPSDRKIKFHNPPNWKQEFKNYAKPPNWTRNIWEMDLQDDNNNGLQNEDLIVWMRTAALPSFRKLYRRINHDVKPYKDGLPAGQYRLEVVYNFQVKSFEGTKLMILSTTSLLGGKNPFLGIAYIVVGAICLLLGIVFLFIHIKCGKRLYDTFAVRAGAVPDDIDTTPSQPSSSVNRVPAVESLPASEVTKSETDLNKALNINTSEMITVTPRTPYQ